MHIWLSLSIPSLINQYTSLWLFLNCLLRDIYLWNFKINFSFIPSFKWKTVLMNNRRKYVWLEVRWVIVMFLLFIHSIIVQSLWNSCQYRIVILNSTIKILISFNVLFDSLCLDLIYRLFNLRFECNTESGQILFHFLSNLLATTSLFISLVFYPFIFHPKVTIQFINSQTYIEVNIVLSWWIYGILLISWHLRRFLWSIT